MDTKEQLKEEIKKWFVIDNEIKIKKTEIAKLNSNKKDISNKLMDIMENNEIDCFNARDGKLVYAKTKTKVSLSKEHIAKCLLEYFDEDENMVDKLSNYIFESRDTKIRKKLQRKKNE
jgi:hypothetical protein